MNNTRVIIFTIISTLFTVVALASIFQLFVSVNEIYTDLYVELPLATKALVEIADIIQNAKIIFLLFLSPILLGGYWYFFKLTAGIKPKISTQRAILILAVIWFTVFAVLAAVPYLLIFRLSELV